MSLRTMVLRFVLYATTAAGPLAPGIATQAVAQQTDEPTAKAAKVAIPVSQLRFYCFSGPGVYSIGAITCLSKGRWGVCKWSDNGSNAAVPPGRAYWQNSVAPSGACPLN